MRSIINSSPKARYSSAFSVEIFVKDYIFSCLSARCFGGNLHVKSKDLNGPEIYLRFYFLKIFLAVGNILNRISPKDLPMVCFVVTQHSESELSLCLRYSKTSSLQATPQKYRFPKLLSVICYLKCKNRFGKLLYCYIVTLGVDVIDPSL